MRFPLEIWSLIINCRIEAASPLDPPKSENQTIASRKVTFSDLSSISLSCRSLRLLVLQKWFTILLHLKGLKDLDAFLSNWKEGATWPKILHITMDDDDSPLEPNHTFTKLRHVKQLGLDVRGISDFSGPQLETVAKSMGSRFLSQIQTLHFEGVAWPDYAFMMGIALYFPNLEELRLSGPCTWCGLCNTCSVVNFDGENFKQIIYEKGLGLPRMYGKILSELEHLVTVIFDLPVQPFSGLDILPYEPTMTDILWMGECTWCINLLQLGTGDNAAAQRLIHQKTEVDDRPPNLQRVEWNLRMQTEIVQSFLTEEDDQTADERLQAEIRDTPV